ncbi:replication initiation protein [Enterococcus hirae]|uniref:replication initiation protein n=1 Tax=Enterococcus hirae TaxID=1354 RepID=UPI00187FEE69|nr:replication initiation protein [Enterococcus hirae]MBE8830341.1 replication initiation protein [Enterococcus hirae]
MEEREFYEDTENEIKPPEFMMLKYKNELNGIIGLAKCTPEVQKVFFSALAELQAKYLTRDSQGRGVVVIPEGEKASVFIPFDRWREISNLDRRNTPAEFQRKYLEMGIEIHSLWARIERDKTIDIVPALMKYSIERDLSGVTITFNSEYISWISEVLKEFTLFNLKEFTGLRSKHSMALYRMLKQYQSNGWYKVSIEELRLILGTDPEKYTTAQFMQKVVQKAIADCEKYFGKINLERYYSKKGGRRLVSVKFSYQRVRDKDLSEANSYDPERNKKPKENKKKVATEPAPENNQPEEGSEANHFEW